MTYNQSIGQCEYAGQLLRDLGFEIVNSDLMTISEGQYKRVLALAFNKKLIELKGFLLFLDVKIKVDPLNNQEEKK